jgi:hypothetical protein
MSYNYQNGGLDSNMFAAESQPMQYPPNNPPPIPITKLPPQLGYLELPIAAMMANIAGAGAAPGSSAARMYTFNRLAKNNWQNPQAAEAFKFICDYLLLGMRKGVIINPDQMLPEIVNSCMNMITAVNAVTVPQIRQHMDQRLMNNAVEIATAYTSISNEIAGMYNVQQPQQPQYQQPQYQQPGYAPQMQQPMYQQPMPIQNGGGFDRFSNRQGGNRGMGTAQQPQQGSSFNIGGSPRTLATNPGVNQASAFTRTAHANKFVPVQQQHVEEMEDFNEQAKELDKDDWRPSTYQPYRTLVDSRFTDVSYKEVNQHGEVFVIENYTLREEIDMDRSQHRLTGLPNSIMVNSEKRTAILEECAPTEMEDSDKIVLNEFHNTENYCVNSLEDIITDFMFRKLTLNKTTECSIYHGKSFILTPRISNPLVKAALTQIANSKSIGGIVKNIKIAINSVAGVEEGDANYKDGIEVNMLCEYLDKMFTKDLNNFLSKQLSLAIQVDSFIEDGAGIGKYLEEKYGYTYKHAFTKFENSYINSFLVRGIEELEAGMFEFISADNLEKDDVIFINREVTVTHIDLTDYEMTFTLEGDEALMIKESEIPWLYKVAKSIFIDNKNISSGTENYLITKDGIRYKIYFGLVANDCYLISRS